MYEAFFGLARNPFSMTPDPAFLYATPSHQEAIAGLLYAIQHHKGFMVLSGDAGTGKTTVLTSVVGTLSASGVHFSWIVNPTLTTSEFLEAALLDFGIANIPESKALRIQELQKFLLSVCQRGETAVLVIDEAHKLRPQVLEEIRLLSNFESASDKLVQIVLAGQTELTELLDRHELRQLKQRIAVRVRIYPLGGEQVAEYMHHRWRKAGGPEPFPFTAEAIAAIARISAGIPRVINAVSDSALLIAFATASHTVGLDHVTEVAADLNLNPVTPTNAGYSNGERLGIPPPPGPLNGQVRASEWHLAKPVAQPDSESMPVLDRYAPTQPKLPFSARLAHRLGIPVRMRTRE